MAGFVGRQLRFVVAVALGSFLVGGGLLLSARLNAVISERVRVGVETTGRVVHVERYQIGRSTVVTRLTVDYLPGSRSSDKSRNCSATVLRSAPGCRRP